MATETRADVIRSSFERLYQLDRQIDEIIDDEVAGLRAEKSEIKAKLREEFQMPAKLVTARYASYKIERTAAASDDATTLAAIKEMFAALPVGGQVDFVAATQPREAGADMAQRLEEAEAAGLAAAKLGSSAETCPYQANSELHARWRLGWAKHKPRRSRAKVVVEDLAAAESRTAGHA